MVEKKYVISNIVYDKLNEIVDIAGNDLGQWENRDEELLVESISNICNELKEMICRLESKKVVQRMVDECSLCGKSVELVVKSRHLVSGNWIGLCTYCLTSLAEDRIRSARISGEKFGRLQGAKDLLKEMKSMYDKFAIINEADDFILGFIKRKWKAEKVV